MSSGYQRYRRSWRRKRLPTAIVGLLYSSLPMRCYSQALTCAPTGALASSNTATGGSNNSSPEHPTSIVVMLDADTPSETLEYIASIAKETTCETDGSQRISELTGFFGSQTGAMDVLIALNPNLVDEKLSRKSAEDVMIPPQTTVVLPEITPQSSEYTWVHLPPGGTVSELADRLGNSTGPTSLEQFKAVNQDVKSLDNVPAYSAVRLPNKRAVEIVTLADGLNAESTSQEAGALPGIRFASQNYEGTLEHPVQIDPDTLASSGAHYNIASLSDEWFISKLGAAQLKNRDVALKDTVVIAVFDSGLDLSHPAFKNDLWLNSSQGSHSHNNVQNDEQGYDISSFVSEPDDTLKDSHGTHVAGIASARYLGTLVPALNAARLDSRLKLMILRVADNSEHVSLGAVTLATEYAGCEQPVTHNRLVQGQVS
jgi:hypothetical protein